MIFNETTNHGYISPSKQSCNHISFSRVRKMILAWCCT